MAGELDMTQSVTRSSFVVASAAVSVALAIAVARASAQQPPSAPAATFRSSIDLVRLSAVVRDHKGRFVQGLTDRDFELIDNGERRDIAEVRRDESGVSIALLFDVSGSMEGHMANAREAAQHVLSWLDPSRDESAVFTFDTRLDEMIPFTPGIRILPRSMTGVVPFGATSLHDAIAETARRVGTRTGRRRAVVVLTDGDDNASHLTPPQVSGIASRIDVPVYLFGIVPSIDNPGSDMATTAADRWGLAGPLSDLAAWTGGNVFVASTPAQRSAAARQLVDEMRHQYLIAFESSQHPGWHPIQVRARQKDLVVRARSGYIAG
jgi:Ca-activated chloride channel homolog